MLYTEIYLVVFSIIINYFAFDEIFDALTYKSDITFVLGILGLVTLLISDYGLFRLLKYLDKKRGEKNNEAVVKDAISINSSN